jgi:hypothetical protein
MAMRRLKQKQVFSDTRFHKVTGEPLPMVLTPNEKYHAAWTQKMVNERFGNALGYEVSITTLTQIVKKVSEQKLYKIAFADYIPCKVGEGTYMSNLTTFRSFDAADTFESGYVNTGGDNTRQSMGDAAIDALNIKINNWVKGTQWSIFELEEAAKSGNWDLVAMKEKTRKRNWDLGLQRIAFLGAKGMNGAGGSTLGLLNQPTGQFDTTLITANLSSASTTTLSTFQQNAIQLYRKNCNYTAYPTHFIVPESDYNGMAAQAAPGFPMKTILALLLEAFQIICQNKNFKILPLAYADAANAGGALNPLAVSKQYTFLNYDEESLVMNVPLQYTNTLANSLDNFQFQNSAYGQHTGVLALRPAEIYYAGF